MNASLTQFLIDVTRGHRKDEFDEAPESTVKTSELDGPLQAAILCKDIGALWLAGAHPMALLYFSRACGFSNGSYYRAVELAESKKAVPGVAPSEERPEPPQTHLSNVQHAR